MIRAIIKRSKPKSFPDGNIYKSISLEDARSIGKSFKVRTRDIEIAALENKIVPERYVRNMNKISFKEQVLLLKSRVSVIGLGGLGGAVAEIIARIGVGTLNLIDGDVFDESNLNRQFLSTEALIGESKTSAAIKRVREINSSITVRGFDEYMRENSASPLISNSHVVVDCLDDIKTRFILERTAKDRELPLVSAAVAGTSGHLTTIYPDDSGLNSIYGQEDSCPSKGAETSLGVVSPVDHYALHAL